MTKNEELLSVLIGTFIVMLLMVGVMILIAKSVDSEPLPKELYYRESFGSDDQDYDKDEKKLKDDIVKNGKTYLTIGGAKDEWRVIAPALLEKLKKKKGLTDAQFLKLVMENNKDFIKVVKSLDSKKDK